MCNPIIHIKRCFLPIRGAEPNKYEAKKLGQTTTTGDDDNNFALNEFCVWRRSMLMVACPSVFSSMILSFVNLSNVLGSESGLNALGIILFCLNECTDLFLLVGVGCSVYWWPHIASSTFALRIGWLVAIVSPLLPALFPLQYVLQKLVVDLLNETGKMSESKITFALTRAISLLPIVLTIPGGAVRASLRIRNLFPNLSLPGWALLISAPFSSLVVLIYLVMITQVAGNVFLLFGTFLLVAKPWVYMAKGSLFVGVSTPETERKIQKLLYIGLAVGLLGTAMIVVWLFTAKVGRVSLIGNTGYDGDTVYLLTWMQGAQLLFEMVGRILVTTVIFCDLIVAIVLRNWSDERKKDSLLGNDRHTDCEAFHKALSRKGIGTKTNNAMEEGTKNDTSTRNDTENAAPAPVVADMETGEPADGSVINI